MIQTKINNHIFKTKVVTSPKNIKNGMMGRNFDNNFDSMLFVMNGPYHSFWMKNCIIPLDVIFIHNKTITGIHHNCPPCFDINENCTRYSGVGELVIEVKSGTCKKLGLMPGQTVKFFK